MRSEPIATTTGTAGVSPALHRMKKDTVRPRVAALYDIHGTFPV